jgi:tetratricopeptide (TPR) repeat protein
MAHAPLRWNGVVVTALVSMLCAVSGSDLSAAAQTSPNDRRRPPSTRDALNRYIGGDFDGAVRSTPMLPRYDPIEAEKWIAAGGRPALARRRLAAATFALEYAAARPHQTQALVLWARRLLADAGAPSPAEALWLRASVALCEGFDLWSFLGNSPSRANHIAFARARFPDDPYLQLADALGSEILASRGGYWSQRMSLSSLAFDRIDAEVRAGDAARHEALARAAGLLENLTHAQAVGAEAFLRLGFVRLRLGDRDSALSNFDRLDALTRDASIRYLGHLFAGWTLASQGRGAEAVLAYRAALNAVPHAQSGVALLMALLLKDEQLADAEAVGTEFLARETTPHDPWQSYFLGDAPVYWTLVFRLRDAIR